MTKKPNTMEDHLSYLNYQQNKSTDTLLEAFIYEDRAGVFHNKSGEFAAIFALRPYHALMLSDDHMRAIRSHLSALVNYFTEGTSGSYVRFTGRNIEPHLQAYKRGNERAFEEMRKDVDEDKWWDRNDFAESIESSMIERYKTASARSSGFMANVDKKNLQLAIKEYAAEMEQDDGTAEAVISNTEFAIHGVMRPTVHSHWLVIKWTPPFLWSNWFKDKKSKLLGTLGIQTLSKTESDAYAKYVKAFIRFREGIRGALQRANLYDHTVDANEYIQQMYEMLNPARALKSPAPKYHRGTSIGNLLNGAILHRSERIGEKIGYSVVDLVPNGLDIQEPNAKPFYYRAASVGDRLDKSTPGILMSALNLSNLQGWTSINFHPTPTMVRARRLFLKKKHLENVGDAKARQGKKLTRSEQKADQDIQEIEESLKAPMIQDRDQMFEVAIHSIVGSSDRLEAELSAENIAIDGFWQQGICEARRGDAILHSSIPLNYAVEQEGLMRRHFPYMSEPLANFFPVYTHFKGVEPEGILFCNRYGCPVFIDLFGDQTVTAHSLIVGTTGTGKSFVTNYIIASVICKYNAVIRIFDKGGSYEDICNNFDGDYVELSVSVLKDDTGRVKATPPCLNPLHMERDSKTGKLQAVSDESIISIAYQLVSLRSSLIKSIDNSADSFSILHLNLLIESLSRFFKLWINQKNIPPTLSSFMVFLRKQKLGDCEGNTIADELKPFYGNGPYAPLIDGQLTFSWTNPFIVIETNKMDGQPILGPMVVNMLRQIGDDLIFNLPKKRKKIIAVDESWQTLADPQGAKVLGDFFRTMRKNNCGILLISQFLSDFVAILRAEKEGGGGGDTGILGNTSHFFFLPSKRSDYALAISELGFDQLAIEMWDRLSGAPPFYSEFFYTLKNTRNLYEHGIVRYVASSIVLWLSSSQPDDRAFRDKRTRFHIEEGKTRKQARLLAVQEGAKAYPFGKRFGLVGYDSEENALNAAA